MQTHEQVLTRAMCFPEKWFYFWTFTHPVETHDWTEMLAWISIKGEHVETFGPDSRAESSYKIIGNAAQCLTIMLYNAWILLWKSLELDFFNGLISPLVTFQQPSLMKVVLMNSSSSIPALHPFNSSKLTYCISKALFLQMVSVLN